MKRTPILTALVLAVSLTACSPKAPEVTLAPTPVPTPSPAPVPTVLEWTDRLIEEDYTTDDGTVILRLRYVFPAPAETGVVAAWDSIGAYYESESKAYLENTQENVLMAQDDYYIAQASGFPFTPYTEGFTYQVTRQTDRLVSIRRTYSSSTSDSDVSGFQFAETFDLGTGARLGLGDLLSGDWQGPLLEQVFSHAVLLSWHPFTLEELTEQFNADYFYLTDDNLVIFYQPGTFGPGSPLLECSVPYDGLPLRG